MKGLALAALALILAGCTHSIHLVHTSDFEPYRPEAEGKAITSEAEQFVIMGFTQQTDYVDQAYADLMRQCADGRVTAITTQVSTSHGFFSWTNKARMKGICFSRN